jgi:hypothetical protein
MLGQKTLDPGETLSRFCGAMTSSQSFWLALERSLMYASSSKHCYLLHAVLTIFFA